jgi:hypothetical protein
MECLLSTVKFRLSRNSVTTNLILRVHSVDEVSRKNVGHDIANLKALAIWSVHLSAEEARARSSMESPETFYDRIKREIAERNGVDVSKVEFEFRIKP